MEKLQIRAHIHLHSQFCQVLIISMALDHSKFKDKEQFNKIAVKIFNDVKGTAIWNNNIVKHLYYINILCMICPTDTQCKACSRKMKYSMAFHILTRKEGFNTYS